uniref:4F5 domain-containing protein n=1 Tax=Macrostomum lignano TaxID=282301 RepID=A0A1I8FJJ3_9PLAT
MARGHQKIQSQQQKNAEKKAAMKKSQGSDQKKAAQKGSGVHLHRIGDIKTYKMHFEAKHPKMELPADLKDVE